MENTQRTLMLRSAWEIDGLAEIVHDQLQGLLMGSEALPLQSILRRVRELAGVQMSACDSDSAPSGAAISGGRG